ncbi:hypothetical protein NDI45_10385 [Leptolyngbya sp. GB1-A1]|uniref:hypothetical protein n=1 Tax=Leptolyngbya sp. GB1-A1 TaxID=2933908 RepID=UPI0032995E99
MSDSCVVFSLSIALLKVDVLKVYFHSTESQAFPTNLTPYRCTFLSPPYRLTIRPFAHPLIHPSTNTATPATGKFTALYPCFVLSSEAPASMHFSRSTCIAFAASAMIGKLQNPLNLRVVRIDNKSDRANGG